MVGKRLATLRQEKGMTQKELAKALGLSLNSVSLYERDLSQPSDETKIQIARLFGVSMDYLMGMSDRRKEDDVGEPVLLYCKGLTTQEQRELMELCERLQKKYQLDEAQAETPEREFLLLTGDSIHLR
ncbi:MAG: helix-turn-helix domain-containing protein [Candidatus Pararuminococcus gallinarum]|uniref:helix-turn-helix domain-containing protein n=1 Tax=Anaerotruncus rubiinfantis TaxID=1720200 RepID=UPI00189A64AA|nr:helix-turn-helix domain-containing protein [Anaerotruncus rubiinfantis]